MTQQEADGSDMEADCKMMINLLTFAVMYMYGCSRKYPYSQHRENWEVQRGGVFKDSENSGGGLKCQFTAVVSRCPSIQYGFTYRSSC